MKHYQYKLFSNHCHLACTTIDSSAPVILLGRNLWYGTQTSIIKIVDTILLQAGTITLIVLYKNLFCFVDFANTQKLKNSFYFQVNYSPKSLNSIPKTKSELLFEVRLHYVHM